MDKLEPCPFCGGNARAWHYYVKCRSCGAETGPHDSDNEAVAAWNDRPHHQRLLQALKEAREALLPFAEACCHLHPSQPDDGETLDGIKVGEWRKAAQALAKIDEIGAVG